MNNQALFLALSICFVVACFVAIAALWQNRRYARLLKQAHQEPSFGLQPAVEAAEAAQPTPYFTPDQEDVVTTPIEPVTATHHEPTTTAAVTEPVVTKTAPSQPAVLPPTTPQPASAQPQTRPSLAITPRDFIVITLLAQLDRPYAGYELLQALLTVGMRFGKLNIFHRHEQSSGQGDVLFSLASAVEPGVFELTKMGSFSSLGLTLFLRVQNFKNSNKDIMQAFETMIETARQLVEDLGGEVCDEQRQPLTAEKINDWRAYLAYYERSRQIPDLFA